MATDNDCCICLNENTNKSFKCSCCNNGICVECFYKISRDGYDNKKSTFTYKCPLCRTTDIYHYKDFNKNDIIYLAENHAEYYDTSIINLKKEIELLKNTLSTIKNINTKTIKKETLMLLLKV